jgi:exodeoxyribonuclease-3
MLYAGALPIMGLRCPEGDDDFHSPYLEAAVRGIVIGCLYLPNGNPQPVGC